MNADMLVTRTKIWATCHLSRNRTTRKDQKNDYGEIVERDTTQMLLVVRYVFQDAGEIYMSLGGIRASTLC